MSRQKMIQALHRSFIALAATALVASAPSAPAEEAASVANPSAANPSVANPSVASASLNKQLSDSIPQPTPPPSGRPTKRGAGARNAAPLSVNLPPATFKLPADYAVLNSRSIFSRTGKAAAASAGPTRPEERLALRGIVSDDKSYFVFIEDTASHHLMQLRPGDPIAGGKVGRISIDDFSFETPAASKRISVGQNLTGAPLPPVTPPAPQPAPGPDQPKPEGPPKNAKPAKEPVFEIGPNGQRTRNLVAERAG